MTTTNNKKTGPLPIVNDFERLEQKGKSAFLDTLRWLTRNARRRIDGNSRRVDVAGKSRSE